MVPVAGHAHEADVRCASGGGAQQHGPQQLQHDGVADVVGAPLHLPAVLGQAGRRRHDAGVGDEDVEARGGEVCSEGGADAGPGGGEVEGDKGELCCAGGGGGGGRGGAGCFGEYGGVGVGVAAGEEDVGWVVFGQGDDGRFADA